jgi:hypothetical protein
MSKWFIPFSLAFTNFDVPANLVAIFEPAVGEYQHISGKELPVYKPAFSVACRPILFLADQMPFIEHRVTKPYVYK